MAESAHDERFRAAAGTFTMTGIQALVRLPMDIRRLDLSRGLSTSALISGYEGSPLGGYDLALARQANLLDELDIVFQPAVNEELAATAVQGSQLVGTFADRRVEGVTGFWYGKSPGVDRASDALRHATLGGTHHMGGAIALVGDDPSAKSSTVPGASEHVLADVGMPILYPADSQELLDLGIHAVHMSRASGLWCAIKIVTNVADGSGLVQVGQGRIRPVAPTLEIDGKPFRHEVTAQMLQPHLTRLERTLNNERLELARRYTTLNGLNRVLGATSDEARLGIVVAGKTYLDVRQALVSLGLDDAELERRGVRLLKLAVVHPLDRAQIRAFAAGLDEVVVVEEKRGFIETAVKAELYGMAGPPPVSGKRTPDGLPLLPEEGELGPDEIAGALASRFLRHGGFPSVESWKSSRLADPRQLLPVIADVARTPYFCSGCPHSRSVKPPAGSLVGGGIGCHALVLVMEPSQVGEVAGLTQMGGEGAQWNGIFPFVERDHLIQNIGDGTFHHSGSLAVRAAVASGAHITYKILYNSAVAMTGGQAATGGMDVPALTRSLRAEGVTKIIVTTEHPRSYRRKGLADEVEVWDRKRLVEAQVHLAGLPGTTVLIHDQECATELRRKRKRGLAPAPAARVVINERVCEGCGDCGIASNCLSVQPVDTEFGRKTRIDQSSCNVDLACLDGNCPSFMTVEMPAERGGRTKRAAMAGAAMVPDVSQLPDPDLPSAETGHTTRVLGIGGSGIVTLSQILTAAAFSAGLHVRSLDQTGLAQKGGAVVSDIKMSTQPIEVSNKAAEGEADLYLGADALVAVDPKHLDSVAQGQTIPVVSVSRVPTGRMVVDAAVAFPDVEELVKTVRSATRADVGVFFDARAASAAFWGDDQFANLLLLGAAYQSGGLPVAGRYIEDAIRLNGVKVEANLEAFRRGRQLVVDSAAFDSALAETRRSAMPADPPDYLDIVGLVRSERDGVLTEIVRSRVAELVAYQDRDYATRYVQVVEEVRAAEAACVPGSSALSEAAARHLYKLMAYKDEYEVARLILDTGRAQAAERFGERARIRYHLHPPVLKALGMKNKIRLGGWALPALSVLARAKPLRGTAWDPFGRTAIRRLERALVEEYICSLRRVLERLSPSTIELAVEIAQLPDAVRGYEEVKLANVETYRSRMNELMSGLCEKPA